MVTEPNAGSKEYVNPRTGIRGDRSTVLSARLVDLRRHLQLIGIGAGSKMRDVTRLIREARWQERDGVAEQLGKIDASGVSGQSKLWKQPRATTKPAVLQTPAH